MTTRAWVRFGAFLGALGGVLRCLSAFARWVLATETARQWLYGAIDVCLVAGLASIYLPSRRRTSIAGTLGFWLAFMSLVALRTSSVLRSEAAYPFAAGAIGVGVLVVALTEWAARRLAVWIPLAFATSLGMGSLGTFLPAAGSLFVASGVVFGVAFTAMTVKAALSRGRIVTCKSG